MRRAVFSLGSTLYTVIEGQPPFGIDSDAIALLHRVAKAEIYRPTKSGPLTDVLLQLLEPDPTRPKYLLSEPWVGYRFVADAP